MSAFGSLPAFHAAKAESVLYSMPCGDSAHVRVLHHLHLSDQVRHVDEAWNMRSDATITPVFSCIQHETAQCGSFLQSDLVCQNPGPQTLRGVIQVIEMAVKPHMGQSSLLRPALSNSWSMVGARPQLADPSGQ
jgi:hypothetical protein